MSFSILYTSFIFCWYCSKVSLISDFPFHIYKSSQDHLISDDIIFLMRIYFRLGKEFLYKLGWNWSDVGFLANFACFLFCLNTIFLLRSTNRKFKIITIEPLSWWGLNFNFYVLSSLRLLDTAMRLNLLSISYKWRNASGGKIILILGFKSVHLPSLKFLVSQLLVAFMEL